MFNPMGSSNPQDLGNGGTVDGDLIITGDLSVSGGISLTLSEVIEGTSTIDITNTEAFLVRKNGDGGDIFVVDTTNSRVGIGVTSAVNTLHVRTSEVSGAGTDSGDTAIFEDSLDARINLITGTAKRNGIFFSDTTRGVGRIDYNHNTDIMEFRAGGTDIMYAKSTGIGINTDSPAKALEIAGSGAEAELVYLTSTQSANTSNRVRLSHRLLTDSQERTSFSLLSGFNTVTDGSRNSIVEFKTSDAGTFGTAMVIDGSNIGIGTTSADRLFHVKDSSDMYARFEGNYPNIELKRTSATSNGSPISIIRFYNDTNEIGRISTWDASDADSGHMKFGVTKDGTLNEPLQIIDSKIGIGTGSPERTVHIMTSDASLASADANVGLLVEENDHTYMELLTPNDKQSGIIFSDGSIAGLINYNHSTNAMTFGTSDGATDVTISSSGYFGIGVSPTANHLHLHEGDSSQVFAHFTNTTTGTSHDDGLLVGLDGSEQANIWNRENTATLFATNNTERMQISAGGNVGIGTASPSVMLNLESATSTAITAENTGNSAVALNLDANRSGADQGLGNINFKWNGTVVAQISGASGADTTNKDDGQIQFSTSSGGSSSVNMTLDKDGKLGIGTSTPTHAKMEIVGDADAFQLTMSDVADSDNATKEARIGMLHYKQAEEPVTLMYAQSGSSTNTIYIGGGTGVGNHATSIGFATASTYNSTSTTTNMLIDNNSRISLSNNDGGANNTTIFGYLAGNNSGSGATQNCYIGHESGKANVYGDDNVLIGFQSGLALGASSGSVQNSLVGSLSGTAITDGDYNTFLGYRTGSTGTNDITTGTFNTFIGKGVAGSSASATNQIAIGADVTAQGDNTVTLGNADVTDVYMAQDSQAYVHAQNVPNSTANSMSSPYYRFDGTNDQIDIADNAALDLSDALSIECLFKTQAIDTFQELVNKADSTGAATTPYRLNITDAGVINAYVANGSSANTAVTSSQLVVGEWYHVVFTADGSNLKLYVNGTLVDTETQTITPEVQSGILTIGRWGDTGGEYYPFLGEIQKVRLYNKALTATEAKEVYSGASVPFKYKGANLTSIVTGTDSNMSGSANWGFAYLAGSNINSTVSGKMYLLGNGNDDYAFLSNVLVKGKEYGFSLKARLNAGSSTAIRIGTALNNTANTFEFTPTGTEQTFTGTFLASGTELQLGTTTAMGSMNGVAFEIDDVLVYPAGAVAEYDGSGIASDKWLDKSGNDLHGTVSGSTIENAPSDSDGLVYEEGTWTPAFVSASGHAPSSITVTRAVYTRIGDVVTLEGHVGFDNSGGGTDPFILSGVPFNFATSSFPTGVANFRFTAFSESTMIYALGDATQDRLTFYYNDGNGDRAFVNYTNTDVASNTLTFTITYII